MTKKQIAKHKEVMLWFIENPDKGVWWKDDEMDWTRTTSPTFTMLDAVYIQNDEYAELRKAQADGKVIQFCHEDPKYTNVDKSCWVSNNKHLFNFDISRYRIKLDEPEFKVGDWVKDMHSVFCEIKDIDTFKIYYTNSKNIEGSMDFKFIASNNIRKWKPTKGEWCVFSENHKKNYSTYWVERFIGICKQDEFDFIAPLELLQTLR